MNQKSKRRYEEARKRMVTATANMKEFADSLPAIGEDGSVPGGVDPVFVEDIVSLVEAMAAATRLMDRAGGQHAPSD